ncbi:MAG: YIP1 family protein [Acidobacteriota bacterium]
METGTASPTAETAAGATQPLPAPGALSVIQVLFAPGSIFARIAERPRALVPLAMVTLLSIGSWGALLLRVGDFHPMAETIMKSRPAPPAREGGPSQEQIVDIVAKVIPIQMMAAAVLAPAIVYLICGTLFWILLRVISGSEWRWKTAFSATIHGFSPGLVASALMVLLVFASPNGGQLFTDALAHQDVPLKSHAGAFVSKDAVGPFAFALLSSLDVFSFWMLALLVLGFARTAKVSKGSSAGVVLGTWLVYVLAKSMIVGLVLPGLGMGGA